MNIFKKVRHFLRTRYGSFETKSKVWNQEFRSGRWSHLENTLNDPLYEYVGKYAKHGNILDMGCGSGATCSEMGEDVFSIYTGVDVSKVAIDSATIKCKGLIDDYRARFIVGDIESFEPTEKYDLILFRESVYYLPNLKIRSCLQRYCKYLLEDGSIIIRMHDKNKYKHITKMLDSTFRVIDKYEPADASTIIYVLKCEI